MEQAKIELLVMDAQNADQHAFAVLFNHFNPQLLRFAYKICHNQQLSYDAVQNAWLKISKTIKQLHDPRAFRSWLFKTTRWQTLDLIKKHQHEISNQADIDLDELSTSEQASFDDELLYHINQLNDIDKQTLHLFYLEQLSLQEVAIVLEIPIGTVKSRLNRARATLKQNLAAQTVNQKGVI